MRVCSGCKGKPKPLSEFDGSAKTCIMCANRGKLCRSSKKSFKLSQKAKIPSQWCQQGRKACPKARFDTKRSRKSCVDHLDARKQAKQPAQETIQSDALEFAFNTTSSAFPACSFVSPSADELFPEILTSHDVTVVLSDPEEPISAAMASEDLSVHDEEAIDTILEAFPAGAGSEDSQLLNEIIVCEATPTGGAVQEDDRTDSQLEITMAGLRLQQPEGSLNAEQTCIMCSSSATFNCSQCKSARYCSKACQTEHWKREHKVRCAEMKAAQVGQGRFDEYQKTQPVPPVDASCTLCLSGEEDGELWQRGCLCRGDAGWVHLECLGQEAAHRLAVAKPDEFSIQLCLACSTCKNVTVGPPARWPIGAKVAV